MFDSLLQLLGLSKKPMSPLMERNFAAPIAESEIINNRRPQQMLPEYLKVTSPRPSVSSLPQPQGSQPARPVATPLPEVRQLMADAQKKLLIQQILESFPKAQGYNPVNIAFRESSLNPSVMGGLGERGLFQILPSTFAGEQRNFPAEMQGLRFQDMSQITPNLQMARWLFDRYGWNPWSTAGPLGLR